MFPAIVYCDRTRRKISQLPKRATNSSTSALSELRPGGLDLPKIQASRLGRQVQAGNNGLCFKINHFDRPRLRAYSLLGNERVTIVRRYYDTVNHRSLGSDSRQFLGSLRIEDRYRSSPLVR